MADFQNPERLVLQADDVGFVGAESDYVECSCGASNPPHRSNCYNCGGRL